MQEYHNHTHTHTSITCSMCQLTAKSGHFELTLMESTPFHPRTPLLQTLCTQIILTSRSHSYSRSPLLPPSLLLLLLPFLSPACKQRYISFCLSLSPSFSSSRPYTLALSLSVFAIFLICSLSFSLSLLLIRTLALSLFRPLAFALARSPTLSHTHTHTHNTQPHTHNTYTLSGLSF